MATLKQSRSRCNQLEIIGSVISSLLSFLMQWIPTPSTLSPGHRPQSYSHDDYRYFTVAIQFLERSTSSLLPFHVHIQKKAKNSSRRHNHVWFYINEATFLPLTHSLTRSAERDTFSKRGRPRKTEILIIRSRWRTNPVIVWPARRRHHLHPCNARGVGGWRQKKHSTHYLTAAAHSHGSELRPENT